MSTTTYFLTLGTVRCVFVACAFLGIFALDKTRRHCLHFAAALTSAYLYNLILPAYPDLAHEPIALTVLSALMIFAFMALVTGLAVKYRVPVDRRRLAALAFGGASLVAGFSFVVPEASLRGVALFATILAFLGFALHIVSASGRRRFTDRALQITLLLASAYFLFKIVATGGVGSLVSADAWPFNLAAGIPARIALNTILTGIALALLAIEVADTIGDLTDRIRNDSMTGIRNRHGFDTGARAMIAEAASPFVPISLIVCDLDYFKAVNDTYGHAGGDSVIKAFAQVLADATGTAGICGRTGGEEFAILLRHSDGVTARLFVEAVRTRFSAEQIADLPADMRCTASFGITEVAGLHDLDAAYRRADRALYRAKDAGRNRVEMAEDPAPAVPAAQDQPQTDIAGSVRLRAG